MTNKKTPDAPRKLNAAEIYALAVVSECLNAQSAYLIALESEQNPMLLAATEAPRAATRARMAELSAKAAEIKAACGVPLEGKYVVDKDNQVRPVGPLGTLGSPIGETPPQRMTRAERLKVRARVIKEQEDFVHPTPEGVWVPEEASQ